MTFKFESILANAALKRLIFGVVHLDVLLQLAGKLENLLAKFALSIAIVAEYLFGGLRFLFGCFDPLDVRLQMFDQLILPLEQRRANHTFVTFCRPSCLPTRRSWFAVAVPIACVAFF